MRYEWTASRPVNIRPEIITTSPTLSAPTSAPRRGARRVSVHLVGRPDERRRGVGVGRGAIAADAGPGRPRAAAFALCLAHRVEDAFPGRVEGAIGGAGMRQFHRQRVLRVGVLAA